MTEPSRIDPRRIDRAEALWLEGAEGLPLSPKQIERTLCAEFEVCGRTARRLLKLARERVHRRFEATREQPGAEVARLLGQLDDAFTIGKQNAEGAVMVSAVQRRAELLGLIKQQVKIDAKVSGLADALASVFDEQIVRPGDAT